MADTPISQLPLASSIAETDFFPADVGTPPITKRVALSTLFAAVAGVSFTAAAAVTIAAARLCYVKSDGTVALADATAEGKECMCFTKAAVAAGNTGTFYISGVVTGLAGLTAGLPYYMTTTPGVIGAVPSTTGNVVQQIGRAIMADSVLFQPLVPITL